MTIFVSVGCCSSPTKVGFSFLHQFTHLCLDSSCSIFADLHAGCEILDVGRLLCCWMLLLGPNISHRTHLETKGLLIRFVHSNVCLKYIYFLFVLSRIILIYLPASWSLSAVISINSIICIIVLSALENVNFLLFFWWERIWALFRRCGRTEGDLWKTAGVTEAANMWEVSCLDTLRWTVSSRNHWKQFESWPAAGREQTEKSQDVRDYP